MKYFAIKHCQYILAMLMAAVAMTACSDHSRPDSPEPTIEIAEATDITRTEATVRATIDTYGSTLSYVALHYGASSGTPEEEQTIEGDPSLSSFEFQLTDLRPGTAYSCHLAAGTATASLKSETITFTTVPNDPPKVSGITPLSTGPLGIILSFSIMDSGGEPIAEAGCEIKQTGGSESRRIYAVSSGTYPEELRLTITGLIPSSTYLITPFAASSVGETRGETLEYTTTSSIILKQPGILADLFGNYPTSDIESLTIAGPMNGDDFRTLRAFLGAPADGNSQLHISEIDLSDISIVEGGESYDGQRFTVADCLSTGIFADCIRLREAILPNSATDIQRDAFARCTAMEVLTIPARIETLLPSAACTALKAIEVSGANPHFKSDQGVLLNADASAILWFPMGKTGEYRFPSTISAIGENAFADTSITSLVIPSEVTSISRGAFVGSALTQIFLPDNLINVSEGMFQNCSSLTLVYLGAATEFIGNFAFDGTSIQDIYLAADYPPYTMEDAFRNGNSTIFGQCTLHVPTGCKKLYSSHRQWGSFSHIEEFKP